MASFSNSLTLFKASWNVLQKDKELLVFPLLSSVSMVLVVASFALPVWLTGTWTVLLSSWVSGEQRCTDS